MHVQDFLAALNVWVWHRHLTVKPTGAQQCWVQNVAAVCGGHDDHTFVRLKPVHFDQQLVQCLFAFVITTAVTCATMATHGVDFVDKHDTGCVFLGLFEHVAHTACTDAYEHFNKV